MKRESLNQAIPEGSRIIEYWEMEGRLEAHLDAMRAKEQRAITKLNWFMGGMMFGFVGGFLTRMLFW